MTAPIRLVETADDEHVVLQRPGNGGGWVGFAALDRLQAANLCADLDAWLSGATDA